MSIPTLTLDGDVAAQLEQIRRKEHAKFKDVVNDALLIYPFDRRSLFHAGASDWLEQQLCGETRSGR